jgi:hypothetical protein
VSSVLGIVVIKCQLLFVPAACWFNAFLMSATELHVKIKFYVLLNKSPSETLQMFEEVYGKAAMNKTLE